jgi:hypothetical protein
MAVEYNVITRKDIRSAAKPAGKELAGAGERDTPPRPQPTTADDAADRLFKYIPSITIGTYLAIQGVVAQINDADKKKWILLIVSLVLLAGTYLYWRNRGVKRSAQIGASLAAFVVWVFALGGPFDLFWKGWEPYMGSIALFLAAFLLVALKLPELRTTD